MAENIHFLNDLIAIISFYNEFRLKTSRHHRERRMLATRLTEGVKTCINEFTVRPRLPVNIKYDVQAIFSYILGNVSNFFFIFQQLVMSFNCVPKIFLIHLILIEISWSFLVKYNHFTYHYLYFQRKKWRKLPLSQCKSHEFSPVEKVTIESMQIA